MLSGVVCSRAAESLPICEAVRYQEMAESDLVRGERCLRCKVDICEVSVADCARCFKCGLITSTTPTQIATQFNLIKWV